MHNKKYRNKQIKHLTNKNKFDKIRLTINEERQMTQKGLKMKNLIFKTGNAGLDTKISNHFDKLVQVFGYSKVRACSICQHLACTANGQSFYNLEYRLGANPRLP